MLAVGVKRQREEAAGAPSSSLALKRHASAARLLVLRDVLQTPPATKLTASVSDL